MEEESEFRDEENIQDIPVREKFKRRPKRGSIIEFRVQNSDKKRRLVELEVKARKVSKSKY